MSILNRLGTLVALPSKLVEELCHAAAAYPWAEELALRLQPGEATAATTAVLADDTPRWAHGVIHHAPQIAGGVLGAAALVAVASGVRPSNPLEVAGTIAAAWWWAKLVAPESRPRDSVDNSDSEQ